MATTIPIVTLTHEQRDAFCSFAWGSAHDSMTCNADPDDEFRFYMAVYRLVDRLQWRSDEPERDIYELPVDADLEWVMAYRLMPDVELLKESLEEEAALDRERGTEGPPAWLVDSDEARDWWGADRAEREADHRNVIAVTDAIQAVMAEVA